MRSPRKKKTLMEYFELEDEDEDEPVAGWEDEYFDTNDDWPIPCDDEE